MLSGSIIVFPVSFSIIQLTAAMAYFMENPAFINARHDALIAQASNWKKKCIVWFIYFKYTLYNTYILYVQCTIWFIHFIYFHRNLYMIDIIWEKTKSLTPPRSCTSCKLMHTAAPGWSAIIIADSQVSRIYVSINLSSTSEMAHDLIVKEIYWNNIFIYTKKWYKLTGRSLVRCICNFYRKSVVQHFLGSCFHGSVYARDNCSLTCTGRKKHNMNIIVGTLFTMIHALHKHCRAVRSWQ